MLNSIVPSRSKILPFLLASRAHPYAYVFVPKAACSTTKLALWLAEQELTPAIGHIDQPMSIHARQYSADSPWLTPASGDYHTAIDGKFLNPIYLFSFVRSPYSRIFSSYRNKILGVEKGIDKHDYFPELGWRRAAPPSFEDFLKIVRDQEPAARNEHWRLMTDILCYEDIIYDNIYKMKNFAHDFTDLMSRILPELKSTRQQIHINDTRSGEHRRSAYSTAAIDLVKEIYRTDFLSFSYAIDVDPADPQNASV
ncbi:sulfotransferase family 2 domain-containing protein [Methylorubrum podarium]|uniref:Sulfotransferase family 2 domain-containing protein n=1 Tax=Methylorubrum podarium TaxID=200476 RepID=A0ABV1QKX9_9HYPH